MESERETFQLNLVGDVMLGRLIDQLFPKHVDEPSEARIADRIKRSKPALRNYSPQSPWGTTLDLLRRSSLNIVNLETSVTTHAVPWPDKVFNYRMHPANLAVLKAAGISYVSLANNHTLDFNVEGLVETVEALESNDIQFAGAGRTALGVTPFQLFGHIFSASDHPRDWSSVPSFHFIDYTSQTKARLKELITSHTTKSQAPLRIFSVNWGPNYFWQPSAEIRALAHFLIDEWVREKIISLSRANGMKEVPLMGKDGQLIIEL